MSRLLLVPRRRPRLGLAWVGALASLALLGSWFFVPRTGDPAGLLLRFLAYAVVMFGVLFVLFVALRRQAR